MPDSGIISKEDLEELSKFTMRAAEHKTLRKIEKPPVKLEKYEPIISSKGTVVETAGLTKSNLKVTRAVNTNFKRFITNFLK